MTLCFPLDGSGEPGGRRNPQGLRSDLGCSWRPEADVSGGPLGPSRSVQSQPSTAGPNDAHSIRTMRVFFVCFCWNLWRCRCAGVERGAAVVGESGQGDPATGRPNAARHGEKAARSPARGVRPQVVSGPPAPCFWRQRQQSKAPQADASGDAIRSDRNFSIGPDIEKIRDWCW